MKITLTSVGSRGDIQPYIALGVGLQRAGFEVSLSAPALFSGLISEYGLRHLPISVNPKEILEQPEFKAAAKSRNPLALLRTMFREGKPLIQRYLDEVYANCQECDAVISSMIPYGSFDAAQKRHIPYIQTLLGPAYPTTAFATFGMAPPRVQFGPFNKLTHHLIDQAFWQFFRPVQNLWRKEQLGLPPFPFTGPFKEIRSSPAPTLLGYSSFVVPAPPDWPSTNQVTGYWFLDSPGSWQPPEDLVSFLKSGSPPIYIGFGSMPDHEAQQMTRLVLDALRRTRQRGIILSDRGGPGEKALPDSVFRVTSVPHTWLFNQVAAVVHHGRAGTTAAGLRAGVPSIITPYLSDQFFWASYVQKLGVGPKSVSYHKLTAEKLAGMIQQVLADRDMQAKSAALGQCIQSEDGVGRAVETIRDYLENRVAVKV